MIAKDDLILKLTEMISREWLEQLTIEQIACDEFKVNVMLETLKTTGPGGVVVSEYLRNFYKKVFLKDVWDAESRGRDFPEQS
jgi:hypothetical protein